MILIIFVVAVLLFPAAAVWGWRGGAARRLTLVTLAAVSALVVLALFVASERGGNRLASTYGYADTATRVLLLVGPMLILPVVASALAVRVTATRVRAGFVYPIAAATALIAAVVGMIIAIYTQWAL